MTAAPTQKLTGFFRVVARGATEGQVIIPLLKAALWNPTFQSFDVTAPDFTVRRPDGLFHPSEHPGWPERMLYHYLTMDPLAWIPEPLDPASVMAITQGHFWHAFIERVLVDAGYLKPGGWCPSCKKVHVAEVHFAHQATGAAGHVDGIGGNEIFEFKTMNGRRVAKIEDGPVDEPLVLASFRTLLPTYYDQGQEYLRISGFRRWRGLILTLEYPYPMREIVMDYDPHWAHQTQAKYLRVREAVASTTMPIPCCGPRSKESRVCPARAVCPMAAA